MTDDLRPPTTTNDSGIPVPSDEHSLTVGPNGPTVRILLSDRGTPRSYRHGYSSHTYSWMNAAGERFWVEHQLHDRPGHQELHPRRGRRDGLRGRGFPPS